MNFVIYLLTLQTNESVSSKKSGTNQFWVSADVSGGTLGILCWSFGRYGKVCDVRKCCLIIVKKLITACIIFVAIGPKSDCKYVSSVLGQDEDIVWMRWTTVCEWDGQVKKNKL